MCDKLCLFCKMDCKEFIIDNEYFYAILDEYPVSPGHVLIVPKQHVSRLNDLPVRYGEAMLRIIDEVYTKISVHTLKDFYIDRLRNSKDPIQKEFCSLALQSIGEETISSADFNTGINNGIYAGQTVNHLHIHLIPRYVNDGGVGIGGVRHVFPERGNYRYE